MPRPVVVIDTNVIVAGLRSDRGASHRVLRLLGTDAFEPVVSVPLVLEYEQVAKRDRVIGAAFSGKEIDAVLDYLCATARHEQVHYLWRPQLRDPADEHVLELAVAAGCAAIVTYNKKDLEAASRFDIELWTALELLERTGELR